MNKTILLCSLLLALFGAFPAFGVTPAGFPIESKAEIIYGENNIVTSETTVTTVEPMYGITVEPSSRYAYDIPGVDHYFAHTITNLGNSSNGVRFHFRVATPEDWSYSLIRDWDADGSKEAEDVEPLSNPLPLSEDGAIGFFVKVSIPSNEVNGVSGEAILLVTGEVYDGGYYIGANGTIYGGPDTMEATDVLTVETTARLRIFRNDARQIYLTWIGGNADIYRIDTTFEASFAHATIEAYNVPSPYTCATVDIQVQDGKTRYYRAAMAGTSAFAPETVGKFDIPVSVGKNMLSSPLVLYANDLKYLFNGQVVGAPSSLYSDKVWTYSPEDDTGPPYYGWDKYWLVEGTGYSPPDGEWYTVIGNHPVTRTIGTDEGWVVEILDRSPAPNISYITIVGEVSSTNRSIPISIGLNLVGSCFPVDVSLEASHLWQSGPPPKAGLIGADNSYAADRVWHFLPVFSEEYKVAWLVDEFSPPLNGKWYTGNEQSDVAFRPGRAYFIQVRSEHGSFFWDYPKPY